MKRLLSSLIFAYLLQQRVSSRPVTVEAGMSMFDSSSVGLGGDVFDRRCLARMKAKAYRYGVLRWRESTERAGLGEMGLPCHE